MSSRRYSLSVEHGQPGAKGMNKAETLYNAILDEIERTQDDGCRLTEAIFYHENVNWHSYIHDCCTISLKFPGVMFELYIKDDDTEEEWSVYFKNGKYQEIEPVVTWPEPTEDGWKEIENES